MSKFKEFMDRVENSYSKSLPASNTSLSSIETALTSAVNNLLNPTPIPSNKKQEFSKKVSKVVRDEEFISEFSDRLGVPSELETEDEFVERGSDVLRKMLYTRFGLRG